jgi:hypothetical protein
VNPDRDRLETTDRGAVELPPYADAETSAGAPGAFQQLLTSSALVMVGIGSSGALLALARVILGRLLGPGGLGEVSALWTLSMFLGGFPTAGVAPLLTRYLAHYMARGRPDLGAGVLRGALFWTVGLSLTITAISAPFHHSLRSGSSLQLVHFQNCWHNWKNLTRKVPLPLTAIIRAV